MPVTPDIDYFALRQVAAEDYRNYRLPNYIRNRLPVTKDSVVVDFGCGFGHILRALRALAYSNLVGIDVDSNALDVCSADGFNVIDNRREGALDPLVGKVDFVIASHVIEHFPKPQIIPRLRAIRRLLSPRGSLLVVAPNAQSYTGCYWAYEDFTHEYLFTSGSLYFVLQAAGFSQVEFVDVECLEDASFLKRGVRRSLLSIYRANYWFWSKVTASATHAQSPNVFSYEVKAIART